MSLLPYQFYNGDLRAIDPECPRCGSRSPAQI